MPSVLKDIRISEVSSVDRGAGRGVKVLLLKREDEADIADPYWKRDFSQEQRDRAAESGAAMPDGSFPIKNAQDLQNAIRLAGKAKNPDAAKAHIKSRARALGLTDELPDTWKRDDSGEVQMTKEELDKLLAESVSAAVTTAVAKALEGPAKQIADQAREIRILKMSDAHKAYMAGCDEETKKKFGDCPDDKSRDDFMDKNPVKKREAPVDHSELAKRDTIIATQGTTIAALQKRLDDADLEKRQIEFKKRAVAMGLTEADGETVRKAFGGDAEAAAKMEARLAEVAKAKDEQIRTGHLFGELGSRVAKAGSAAAEMDAKAEDLRKSEAGKGLTKEQAFAKVADTNPELFKRVRDEEQTGKRLTVVAA